LEEIGVQGLTTEQIEMLCETAERAVRAYILSKVPLRRIETFDVTIEIEKSKPVTVNVDLEIILSPLMKDYDVKKLADEATAEAFKAVEEHLRELTCESTK